MKMNTLYMAVAATAFGLSSNAMAALNFTDGNLTGSVDIGGDIVVPLATNFWQWATSDAIALDKNVTTLTNNYKTMTIPMASNLPLLVGQTTAATVGNASTALNPQIAFQDGTGTTVIPVWDNSGNSGKGTITLPVTAPDNTPLGTMNMRVKVGGIRAAFYGGALYLLSTSRVSTGVGLYGGAALPSAPAGVLATGTLSSAWCAALGTLSAPDLRVQLNTASGINNANWGTDVQDVAAPFSDPHEYYSGTYGLGVAQGDNITVNFTNPVTNTTTWKTSLKATITYL